MRLQYTVSLALMLAACASRTPAPTQPGAESSHEERTDAVLKHFDQDKDGRLSEDEYIHGVMTSFHYTDHDQNLALHKSEIGIRWNAQSETADANGDGKISLHETLKTGERAFEERDANRDGYISRDEITRSMQNQTPASQPAANK